MKNSTGLLAIALSFSLNASASISALSFENQGLQNVQEFGLDTACPTPESCSGNPDYFGELEKLYAEGTVPINSEVVGWYSGRCYTAFERTTPVNNLLAGVLITEGANHGPLFPGTETLKLFAAVAHGKGADFFDNMAPSSKNALQSFLNSSSGYSSVPPACVADASLAVPFGNNTLWQVRKSRNYLLIKMLEYNTVSAYCYHFKKVN